MALIAVQAVVDIALDVGVVRIGLRLRMAIRTNKHRVVRGISVAGSACSIVAMRKLEPSVVERCAAPARRGVASVAGGRESSSHVVRISCGSVDGFMAAIAIGRRPRELVADVTTRAGNGCMRTG